jgi:hypothetical protein
MPDQHADWGGASRTYGESSDALPSKSLCLKFRARRVVSYRMPKARKQAGEPARFDAPLSEAGPWRARGFRRREVIGAQLWTVRFSSVHQLIPPGIVPDDRLRISRNGRVSSPKHPSAGTCFSPAVSAAGELLDGHWRRRPRARARAMRTMREQRDGKARTTGNGRHESPPHTAPSALPVALCPHLCSPVRAAAGVQSLSGQLPGGRQARQSHVRQARPRLGDGSTAVASPQVTELPPPRTPVAGQGPLIGRRRPRQKAAQALHGRQGPSRTLPIHPAAPASGLIGLAGLTAESV